MDVENSLADNGPNSKAGDPPAAATVLLVEDNEDNILTVADYLTFKNYRVIVARNGRECLEIAVSAVPDIILMDIQMPEVDGLEAIRRLRRMSVWNQKPDRGLDGDGDGRRPRTLPRRRGQLLYVQACQPP